MGFEITQGAVFYIVMMLIVILLGIALVTGFKMPSLSKVKALSQTFEPGRIYVTNGGDLAQYTRLDCSEEIYKLTLDGLKFATKKGPNDNTGLFKFIAILDYNSLLFVGKTSGLNDEPEIVCRPDGEVFVCPDNVKLEFALKGVGAPQGNQTFHFTTWESNPATKNAITPGMTLDKLLDGYGQYYISSFDITTDIQTACQKDVCTKINEENACKQNNENGCYWGKTWSIFGYCTICPDHTACTEYTVEQCTQCPIATASCKLATTGSVFNTQTSCVPV